MKTHFTGGCGRGKRTTDKALHVDCLVCQRSEAFLVAKQEALEAKQARFLAQKPQQFSEPWTVGNIVCGACGSAEFRMGDRTCYGHYQNYHCASCGNVESRLTETGMSF